jgi:hypothetical protein
MAYPADWLSKMPARYTCPVTLSSQLSWALTAAAQIAAATRARAAGAHGLRIMIIVLTGV